MDYIKDLQFPTNLAARLEKLYSNTKTQFKQESTNFLQLMSCNIFRTQTNSTDNANNDNNIHKRCTIQSNQISTISSLVDKSKINIYNDKNNISTADEPESSRTMVSLPQTTTTTSSYDTQRENYGLYALKCNRNAIRRDTLLANLSQETKHKINVYPSQYITAVSPAEQQQYYIDVNHEIFSPCQMENEQSEALNSLNYNREYYKIEFSEEGGLKEIAATTNEKNSGINTLATKSDGNGGGFVGVKPSDIVVCDSNSKTFKTQIPPPPRKKKISVPQQQLPPPPTPPPPTSFDNSSSSSSVGGCSNLVFKSKPQPRLLESCKQNDLLFCGKRNNGDSSIVKVDTIPLQPPSIAKVNEQHKTKTNNIDVDMNKLKFRKNPSELYRIAEMSNKSEKFHDNDESNIPATRTAYVVHPPLRKKTIQRKQLTKQCSQTDSVNIFEKTAPENAFDDFSDILSDEPIVLVKNDIKNSIRKFSYRFSSSSDSDEVVEFSRKPIKQKTVTTTADDVKEINKIPKAIPPSHQIVVDNRKNSYHSLSRTINKDRKITKQINNISTVNNSVVVRANKQPFINNPYNNNHNNNLEDSQLYISNDGNYDDDDDEADDQQNLKQTAADEGDGLCTQVLCNDNHNKRIYNNDMERKEKLNNINGMECYARNVKGLPPQNRNVYKIINLVTV